MLTFAVPKESLEKFIPECVTLDTFQDRWAFVAVAMVQTKNLRPKGFPLIFGNDFFLIRKIYNCTGKASARIVYIKIGDGQAQYECAGQFIYTL